MKRLLLLFLAFSPIGCLRYEGPLEVYNKSLRRENGGRGDKADLPGYTTAEQRDRARERLALPEQDPTRTPTVPVDGPGGVGR
ncbi:MAG TPA: hypothetical protein VH092_21360 [Urbifossiella sp.]|jgi:hypothetical protein|nr:hypothetical protein [Urbifossiella sp.]